MKDDRKDLPPVGAPNFQEKLRETLQTYLGKRGDVLDRGVTLRDLSQANLVALRAGLSSGSGSRDPISGPGAGLATAYETDLSPPPTAEGFNVVAGVGYFTVFSNVPAYTQGHGHAATVVYGAVRTSGGPVPVFADAFPIGSYTGQTIRIPADPLTTWHVWVKWQSVDGAQSQTPSGGANGVVVMVGQGATSSALTKESVSTSDTLTIPVGFQYLVYGTFAIEGKVEMNGRLVLL